jgi:hypothetical protein
VQPHFNARPSYGTLTVMLHSGAMWAFLGGFSITFFKLPYGAVAYCFEYRWFESTKAPIYTVDGLKRRCKRPRTACCKSLSSLLLPLCFAHINTAEESGSDKNEDWTWRWYNYQTYRASPIIQRQNSERKCWQINLVLAKRKTKVSETILSPKKVARNT